MNIMQKFTLRTLKKNKTRTIVTIIGIMLSAALITAVLEGWYSLQRYMVKYETAKEGSWITRVEYIDEQDLEKFTSLSHIKEYTCLHTLGYSQLPDTKNSETPYLCVRELEENYQEFLPELNLLQGRMPRNGKELIVTKDAFRLGNLNAKLGDTISIELGERVNENGELLPDQNALLYYNFSDETEDAEGVIAEKLTNISSREYTIVGICNNLVTGKPSLNSWAGYEAYTVGTEKGIGVSMYTHVDDLKNASWVAKESSKLYKTSKYGGDTMTEREMKHNDLLLYEGASDSKGFFRMMYTLCAILIGIVMIASISLIYNAFAISISERTKLYGLLRSIGATKSQIRSSVLFEALVLCVIGVPLGLLVGMIGIGITLWAVNGWFQTIFSISFEMNLGITVNGKILLFASVLAIVTVLISASYPAVRALRITIMETLRQNRDIKIPKNVYSKGKISYRLFGFEGMLAKKNGMRNKKRQRNIVISLAISIVLFVTITCMMSYLTSSTEDLTNKNSSDVFYGCSRSGLFNSEVMERIAKRFQKEEEISSLGYGFQASGCIEVDEKYVDSSSKIIRANGKAVIPLVINFVDNASYKEFLEKQHVNVEKYMDSSRPSAIYDDRYNYYDREKKKRFVGNVLKDGVLENGQFYFIHAMENYNESGVYFSESNSLLIDYYNMETDDEKTKGLQETSTPFSLENIKELNGLYPLGAATNSSSSCSVVLFLPYSVYTEKYAQLPVTANYYVGVKTKKHEEIMDKITSSQIIPDDFDFGGDCEQGFSMGDQLDNVESTKALLGILGAFSYGFIIIVSLIIVANIFNTISTNISLRKQEFAMLQSVGMSKKKLNKMLRYESMVYGFKALVFGLPIAIAICYWIYYAMQGEFSFNFYLPVYSIFVVIVGTFAIVFASMVYSREKMKNDNPMENIRNEMV